jgi:hypothetical protein
MASTPRNCSASWAEVEKDTAHFGAQITTATGTLTPALASLGLALTGAEGGSPAADTLTACSTIMGLIVR